jgi:acyl-CoA ligase (AMP-forming) (exosortase A-associated)
MMLLHDLIIRSVDSGADRLALLSGRDRLSYAELAAAVLRVANGLTAIGVRRGDRVAIFLPKTTEAVAAMFGASAAGGVFVPINPVLKAAQVGHILRDSGAKTLITTAVRAEPLAAELAQCPDLSGVVIVDGKPDRGLEQPSMTSWDALLDAPTVARPAGIDADMAAILYTSGSTGRPKGVVLSHRNMVAGAQSVAEYLANRETDRLLAVLPFSFDYGFSQLSTAFLAGASVALIEYLLPRDVVAALHRYTITGLAAVPPLWIQLAALDWPPSIAEHLRYITNSGGAMPTATLKRLRAKVPSTSVFLMYGLTEAFRSTYLPPDQVDVRPTSIGRAIPNAEILVVRPDGTPCAAGEPGELVHRGALVSLGYWNDAEKTALRFRPAPGRAAELTVPELAVWSGDTVVKDEEGYLYFVGRRDEMIKTSGYRVSPTEIEEVLYATGLVAEVIAFGAPHPVIGQAIVVVGVASGRSASEASDRLLAACRDVLPTYMLPAHIEWRESLPRNANGKIDRPSVAALFATLFVERANG